MWELQGNFSYAQMMKAIPDSTQLALPIANYVRKLAEDSRSQKITRVASINIPVMLKAIQASSMTTLDKAKSGLQIQNGFIEGELLSRYLTAGMPGSSKPIPPQAINFSKRSGEG
jgi:hypothetical protein